jgi:CheY-like chemotaxis protein
MPLGLTKEFKRAIQEDPSKCILFVGAGLSASKVRKGGRGLPDWEILMRHMVDDLRDSGKCEESLLLELENHLKAGNFLLISNIYKSRTRPDQFTAFLRSELDPPDIINSRIHELILRINFRGIITTNFDLVFEHQDKKLHPLAYPHFLEDIDAFRNQGFFAKIHGCIRNTPNLAKNLILTEESYTELRSNLKYQTILRSIFVMYPILTVGFSLRDPDFLGIIEDLSVIFGEEMPTVYSLMSDPGIKTREKWRCKGVEIIPYKYYTELLEFFEELLSLSENYITLIDKIPEFMQDREVIHEVKKLNEYQQNENYRIVLADNYMIIRSGLKNIINNLPRIRIVGEAEDVMELSKLLKTKHIDMVIMDISISNFYGIEFINNIKQEYPNMNVLVLTMHKRYNYFNEAMTAGANGYLLKDDTPKELIIAISKIIQGEIYVSPLLRTELANLHIENRRE